MREVGTNWVAYYAEPDTMHGAVKLGEIQLAFIANRPERKKVFMDLMRECVGDILEHLFGERPVWPEGERPAPFFEQTGQPAPEERG